MTGSIRIGPAGWSYDDWQGTVYPRPLPRGFRPLALIASWFDVVEINVCFYRIPAPSTSERWLAEVEPFPGFRFAAKVYRELTHEGRLDGALISSYRGFLEPLVAAGRLEAVLAQFPWSFRATGANRDHLARLAGLLGGLPLVAEFRHDSWWHEEHFDLLRREGISVANIDQPALRNNIPPDEVLTGPLAYIRFHGRNAEAWWAEEEAYYGARYDYLYTRDELAPWLARIRRVAPAAKSTIIVMNNHHRGDAVVNGIELAAELGLARGRLPRGLFEEHREKLGATGLEVEPAAPAQGDLFE